MTRFSQNSVVEEPVVANPPEPLSEGEGPFRPNVAALISRKTRAGIEVLLGERHDTPGAWQWPQGGIDAGESPHACLLRELREEIGVDTVHVLHRFPFRLRYRFPISLSQKFQPYLGQEQIYFIAALDPASPPDLKRAVTPEFRELGWRPLAEANSAAVWFKWPVYRRAVGHALEICGRLAIPG